MSSPDSGAVIFEDIVQHYKAKGFVKWKTKRLILTEKCLTILEQEAGGKEHAVGIISLDGATIIDVIDPDSVAEVTSCTACGSKLGGLLGPRIPCDVCKDVFCKRCIKKKSCRACARGSKNSSHGNGTTTSSSKDKQSSKPPLTNSLSSAGSLMISYEAISHSEAVSIIGKKIKSVFGVRIHGLTSWFSSVESKSVWIKAITSVIGQHYARQLKEAETSSRWEIDFSEIVLHEKIGDGAFGEVFRGTLWGTEVAVKTFKSITDKVLGDLQKEVEILSNLRHPNVVLYIGACTRPPNVCLVTEWCVRGSLYDVLHDPSIVIDVRSIVRIAIGIAQGMNYLHSLQYKFIHRDLKSHNILLDSNFNVKVADFGLSHVISQVKRRQRALRVGRKLDLPAASAGGYYGVYGTPEWMAPEVMEGQSYNQKVDTYSYGVVLSELLTRKLPFRDKLHIRSYMDIVDAVLDEGVIPTIPRWAGRHIQKLMEECLSRNVAARPSFAGILSKLRVQFPPDYDSYFVDYDIRRLKEMLLSKDKKTQLMAAREIASARAPSDKLDLPCNRCGYASESFKDLPLDVVGEFISSLASLSSSSSAQLVLYSCRALSSIFSTFDAAKCASELVQDRRSIVRLLKLGSCSNEFISDAAFEVVRQVSLHINLQPFLLESEIGGTRLGRLSSSMALEIDSLRKKRDELSRIILQKESVLGCLSEEKKNFPVPLEHMPLEDTSSASSSSPKGRINGKTFEAPAIEEITIFEAPAEWRSHFRTYPLHPSGLGIFCTNAWKLEQDSELWKPVHVVVVPGEMIRVYLSSKDDPLRPNLLMYSYTPQDKPTVAELCRKHGKPHCIYLDDGAFDAFLCFRSYGDAIRVISTLHPNGEIGPISDTELAISRNRTMDSSDILELAEQLLDITLVNVNILLDYHGFKHQNVLNSGYLLLLDPITHIWAPFFCILLRSGSLKFYEWHNSEPLHPSGVIYFPAQGENPFRIITPRLTPAHPELSLLASEWSSLGLTLVDDELFIGYDICAPSVNQRTLWIDSMMAAFNCSHEVGTGYVHQKHVILQKPISGSIDLPMESGSEGRVAFRSNNDGGEVRDYLDDMFGFVAAEAPVSPLIPAGSALIRTDSSWVLDTVTVEDGMIITGSLEELMITSETKVGRVELKLYCIYSENWAVCVRGLMDLADLSKLLGLHHKIPLRIHLALESGITLSTTTTSELIGQVEGLPTIVSLGSKFIDRLHPHTGISNIQLYSYVLFYDSSTEIWVPGILILHGLELRLYDHLRRQWTSALKILSLTDGLEIGGGYPIGTKQVDELYWARLCIEVKFGKDCSVYFLCSCPVLREKWSQAITNAISRAGNK